MTMMMNLSTLLPTKKHYQANTILLLTILIGTATELLQADSSSPLHGFHHSSFSGFFDLLSS
jgi:hypothetical protein